MGGKGSGRYKRTAENKGNGVPYEQNTVWQANDVSNVDPDVNHRVINMGIELMKLPEIQFDDPEVIEERFYVYLGLCDKYQLKPMLKGWTQALGISQNAWCQILRQDRRQMQHYRSLTPATMQVFAKIQDFMQYCWENYLMEEQRNPVKWIFLGKNYFGYEDQTVRIQREEIDQLKLGDPVEIAAKYARLLGKPTSEPIEIEPVEVTVVDE